MLMIAQKLASYCFYQKLLQTIKWGFVRTALYSTNVPRIHALCGHIPLVCVIGKQQQ
jgi:hypothetical protein